MASVEEKIRNASGRNTALLEVLSRTDYAPPALKQQEKLISTLLGDIANYDEEILNLTEKREKLSGHRKYHDSSMKRFAYKATGQKGKFALRADQEEQEYLSAIRAEHQAKTQREELATQVDVATQAKFPLEQPAAEHDKAQKELDALYNSIFEGPTPAYADEDTQELAVAEMLNAYRGSESNIKTEEQIHALLEDAVKAQLRAQKQLRHALEEANEDCRGFRGENFWEDEETLRLAERYLWCMHRFVAQAQSLTSSSSSSSPSYIQPLQQFTVSKGAYMEFKPILQGNLKDLGIATDRLHENQKENERRLEAAKAERTAAMEKLEESRRKLQGIREKIIEETMAKTAAGKTKN